MAYKVACVLGVLTSEHCRAALLCVQQRKVLAIIQRFGTDADRLHSMGVPDSALEGSFHVCIVFLTDGLPNHLSTFDCTLSLAAVRVLPSDDNCAAVFEGGRT